MNYNPDTLTVTPESDLDRATLEALFAATFAGSNLYVGDHNPDWEVTANIIWSSDPPRNHWNGHRRDAVLHISPSEPDFDRLFDNIQLTPFWVWAEFDQDPLTPFKRVTVHVDFPDSPNVATPFPSGEWSQGLNISAPEKEG